MPFLIVLLALSSFCFAGFEKVSIKNLDFEYASPYGKGTLEKVTLGHSMVQEKYPVEVNRMENSFELVTPFLDFSWNNPWKFVHELKALTTSGVNMNLGGEKHTLTADKVIATPKGRGEYRAESVSVTCEGKSTGELKGRLFEDCREKMSARAKRVDVPNDFILYRILFSAPPIPRELDIPAYDLEFTSKSGNFALLFTFQYYVFARLRAYGHFQYENDYKTIAIRVDQIKFGYIPVTSFVMRRLKEVITNPNVTVDPPWIRINVSDNEGPKN